MMNIREMSLNKLIEEMYTEEDQSEINIIAYEIACRVYVPFGEKSFEELFLELGYVPLEKKEVLKSKK